MREEGISMILIFLKHELQVIVLLDFKLNDLGRLIEIISFNGGLQLIYFANDGS